MKKKILLIVGAITAFVLSAVGILKYKNETSTVSLYGVPSIENNNWRIEQYEGNINGKELKNLIRNVNASNKNGVFPTDLIINDNSNAGIKLLNNNYSGDNIVDSNLYEISLDYDEENGYITNVNVSDVKGEN